MEKQNSQLEHGQLMEQTIGLLCPCAKVLFIVNHNTSITSGN